jgi:hypothetical protein
VCCAKGRERSKVVEAETELGTISKSAATSIKHSILSNRLVTRQNAMSDDFVPDSDCEQSLLLSRSGSPLSAPHDAPFGEELENETGNFQISRIAFISKPAFLEEPANKSYTLSSISQFTSTVDASLKPTFESPINQFSANATNSTAKKSRQGDKSSQKWIDPITIDLSDDEVVPVDKPIVRNKNSTFVLEIPRHPAVTGLCNLRLTTAGH